METVSFEGVEYVKAAVAAKQFRYTSDYIGQLCRAKKVNARLVGRTWFVTIDSIKAYRSQKRQKKTRTKDPDTTAQPEISVKKTVPPVLKGKTARILELKTPSKQKTRHLSVSYDVDEESLIPTLTKVSPAIVATAPPQPEVDESIPATKIKIAASKKKPTTFVSDELPEIALSGKLKIQECPDEDVNLLEQKSSSKESDNKPKNKDVSDKREKVSIKINQTKAPGEPEKKTKKIRGALLSELKKEKTLTVSELSAKKNTPATPQKTFKKDTKAINTPHAFTPQAVLIESKQSKSVLTKYAPLFATAGAILLSAIVWSLSYTGYAGDVSHVSGLKVSLENFLEIIAE